ncbi:MAG: hypothetical protein ACOC9O_02570 [Myxococcota bacterium]
MDVHGVGPVKPREAEALRLISPEVVTREPTQEIDVLTMGSDGRCLFLTEGGCALHASLGPEAKPHSCRRFPFGLVATPNGGRITTEHRCPCRTLGDRPAVDEAAAEAALRDGGARLRADYRVGPRIPLAEHRSMPFEQWERHEATLLERLSAGEDPMGVLGGNPFPEVDCASWEQIASEMLDAGIEGMDERGYETRFEAALHWFGETVLALVAGHPPERHDRPWADAFDGAEARSPDARTMRDVLADWVADELWALRWAPSWTFRTLQAELGTRLAVADHMARRLVDRGVRPDRAAAEAVTVGELVGTSDWWTEVVHRMRL